MPSAPSRKGLPFGVILVLLQACSTGDEPRNRNAQGGKGGDTARDADPGAGGATATGGGPGSGGGGVATGGGTTTGGGTGAGGGPGTGGGTGTGGNGSGGDTGTGGGSGSGGGTSGSAGSGGTGGARPDASPPIDPMLPCRAKAVVDAKCSGACHTAPPTFGAPMSLVSWQDWHKPALDGMRKVYQSAQDRIHRTGQGRMPQNGTLSASEMSTLDAWLAAAAPAGDNCPTVPPPDAGTRIDAGLPDSPTDDGTECVELRAHGQQVPGDRTPFDSSMIFLPGVEFYACFNFSAPWNKAMQGLQFSTIIDNSEKLHHWLLYSSPLAVQDGTYSYCTGQHPGQTLITGWAPGNDGLTLPPDVGLELAPPTGSYVLEVHYNNPSLQPFQDRSGVRVCATSKFRPNTASITWAGTERINIPARAMGTATGNCIPLRTGIGPTDPIHIFHAWPHMHKLGVRMSTVINRAAGGQDLLIDKPFNFASQVGYDVRFTLQPGDSLFTTCYYDNVTTAGVGFGPSTAQEMCYDFLYAYPAHALDHPPFGGVITSGAANLCTDN